MSRVVNQLTARKVDAIKKAGLYADGFGLYLQVIGTGAKTWIFRYSINGRRRDMGLGSATLVPLAQAREKAFEARRKVKIEGLDPIDARNLETVLSHAPISFMQVANEYIQANNLKWSNPKTPQQWRNTLSTYCGPIIGAVPISQINTELVLKCLKPIWTNKTVTAGRLRGRIEKILDYARVMGFREGENPARWQGHLDQLLPSIEKIAPARHHAAMPYSDISAFTNSLYQEHGIAAKALIFLILTASRTNEIIRAEWQEIDFESNSWSIPASRMKANKEHRVPLSPLATQVLHEIWDEDATGFIFSNKRTAKPLSNMAMLNILRRRKLSLTVHGFRSTFRTWAAEKTNVQNDVAEAALAHTVGSKVVAAYQRGDLFEKRRKLMNEWAKFICDG